MKSRIMYVEPRSGRHAGKPHIGRVTFSKSGATLYYAGKSFQGLKGSGLKANYACVESDELYWIADPKADGQDSPEAKGAAPEVDADVHDEYWSAIRGLPVPPPRQDQPS